jgi:hypothetical protein
MRLFNIAACYLFQKRVLNFSKNPAIREKLCFAENPAFYAFGDDTNRFSGAAKDIEICGGLGNYK